MVDVGKDAGEEVATEVVDGDVDGPQNDAQVGKDVERDVIAATNGHEETTQPTSIASITHTPLPTTPTSVQTHTAQTHCGGTRATKPYPTRTGKKDKQRDLDHQHVPAARHLP